MMTIVAVLGGIFIPILIILAIVYVIVLLFALIGGAVDGSDGFYANPFPRCAAFAYNITFRMTDGQPARSQINRDKYYSKNR